MCERGNCVPGAATDACTCRACIPPYDSLHRGLPGRRTRPYDYCATRCSIDRFLPCSSLLTSLGRAPPCIGSPAVTHPQRIRGSLPPASHRRLPNFFMGPTLYDTRVSTVNSRQQPCQSGETCFLIHVDMLHESPLCMGLVHDDNATTDVSGMGLYSNVYWAFGGGHRQLVRFDFESDHGPGSMDHSRASVRRHHIGSSHLLTSPHISSHLLTSPHISPHLPTSPGISRYLPVPPRAPPFPSLHVDLR